MRDHFKYAWILPSPLYRVNKFFNDRQFEKAFYFAEQGIARGFRDARMFNLAAACAAELKLFERAEAYWQEALSMRPNYSDAAFGMGVMCTELGRLEEAEIFYRKAIASSPNYAEALCNLGNILCEFGHLDEAESYYRRVIELRPEWVNIKNNLSFTLLARGHFEEGWALREVRYDPRLKGRNSDIPPVSFPQWRGEPLTGKSIVVWDEQGFGDAIQFARYVKILKQNGAEKITFVCRQQLKKIFETLEHVDRVAALDCNEILEPHDYWTFPLSLAMFHRTTLENIISDESYLSVPKQSREKWRGRIPQTGFRIGLVWKGSSKHPKDRDRSLASLEMLRPLWNVPGVTFISLQKGQGEDEALSPPPDLPLLHLGSSIEDFADTAAILEQLDLLISVDTAIVHLAGALGRKTWVMVPFLSDWRWLIDREDSPWYPSLRLFREQNRQDWPPVIERMRSELVKTTLQAYLGKSRA